MQTAWRWAREAGLCANWKNGAVTVSLHECRECIMYVPKTAFIWYVAENRDKMPACQRITSCMYTVPFAEWSYTEKRMSFGFHCAEWSYQAQARFS